MTQKVTIRPNNQAAQEPTATETPDNVVIDSRGRRLVIDQPDFLTESRIMRALGDSASNQHYVMAYVMPAVMVVQIDDAKVPFPTTLQQIEGAITRVGREGMVAVLSHFAAKAEAAQSEGNPGAEALKNS